MALLTFFLGLSVGVGFWLWQQTKQKRQLRRLIRSLVDEDSEIALPMIPRLRSAIAFQVQQREELQAQLHSWQQLLEVAPLAYLQIDDENQLVWCNCQARQLLSLQRWEPGQVRLLLELVRSYELDQLIEQTRDRQQLQVGEWVFHPTSTNPTTMGEMRSLTLRASSLPLQNGEVGVFVENIQPLVELRRARERDLSDLAHELRTPLTSIRLVVETLQKQLESSSRRWVDRLMPEVDRLINLVQTWLELSQLEANKGKLLNYRSVELRSLIYSVWETLEPLAQQQQLNFTYQGPETLWLTADADRLYRVFLNLFDNSIKYSPPEQSIRVEINILLLGDAPSKVEINIVDSGCGFPESDLPYVFDRLFRGERSRARQQTSSQVSSGSGLGLAIVRQIILAHGGEVKAMNHPDGGAWLQIQLPYTVAEPDNYDYS